MRYFLNTTPYLVLNSIYFILLSLSLLSIIILFLYGLPILKNKTIFKSYILFWLLILFCFIVPLAIGIINQNEPIYIIYDLIPLFYILPFFGILKLFRDDSICFKELFIILLIISLIFGFTYLKSFVVYFYQIIKDGSLTANNFFWHLKDLKLPHRYLLLLSFSGIMSLIVLLNFSFGKERKYQLISFYVFCFIIHLIFFSRNQLIGFILTSISIYLIVKFCRFFRKKLKAINIILICFIILTLILGIIDPLGKINFDRKKKSTLFIRYFERTEMLDALDGNYILGKGLGSKFTFVRFKREEGKYLTKSHNSFLNFIFKGGIFLFLYFAYLFIIVIKNSFYYYQNNEEKLIKAGFLYLLGFFILHLIRSGQDNIFYGNEQMAYLSIHLALYYSLLPGKKSNSNWQE
jgi:O-antigen ligase